MPAKEGYKASNDFKMSYQSIVGLLMYTVEEYSSGCLNVCVPEACSQASWGVKKLFMIDRFYIPLINSIHLQGLVPTISTLSFGLFRIKTQHILYLVPDQTSHSQSLLSAAILVIRTIYTSKQSKIFTSTSVALQTTSSAFKAYLSHLPAILTPYRVMTPP
jgi:hypothetical protein